MLAMAAVVALKVTQVAAATTVTVAGTVSVEFVLVKITVAPPAGAGWVRVTVQLLEVFGPRVLGLQISEETSTGAARVIVALADVLL